MIKPSDPARPITLGGTDEQTKLNLTPAELNQITAQTLVLGWGNGTGGIQIKSPIKFYAGTTQALSLLQSALGSITQDAGATLQIPQLNADAGFVDLRQANDIQIISGRARAGSFLLASASSTGTLQIGTVDGVKGILASDQAGTPTFYPVEITLIDPPATQTTQTTTAASAPSVTPTLTQAADATVEGRARMRHMAGAAEKST